MHAIDVGSYVAVTVQVAPGTSEPTHELPTVAVPGVGVIVPETWAAAEAAEIFRARSPSLTSVAETRYEASGIT